MLWRLISILPVCADRESSGFPTVRRCLGRPARMTVSLCFFPLLLQTPEKLLPLPMRASALRIVRRGLATAAAHPPHANSSSSHVTAAASAIPLSNVEAQWATLNLAEQTAVHQQLEELQRKDWNTLSLAEKKAGTCLFLYVYIPTLVPFPGGSETILSSCLIHDHVMNIVTAYYVAFGPHGPRSPVNPPGTTVKIITGVSVLIGTAGLLYTGIRAIGVSIY